MRLIAVLLCLPILAFAQINFNGTHYDNCSVTVICGSAPAPTPTPTPPPTPAPYTPPPAVAGVVMQTMCVGGSNNYVYDLLASQYQNDCRFGIGSGYYQPAGTIQSFPIPQNWKDGAPLIGAGIAFTSTSFANGESDGYEVALSKTPGDFEYYKSPAAAVNYFGKTYHPCGQISGADQQLGFSTQAASPSTCKIDGGQWFLNWRVLNCRGQGHTCGLTFSVPRG
jgi:hypothetical protein